MVRKGTKPQYKSFNAPPELASNLQQQALVDQQEKERVKRYVHKYLRKRKDGAIPHRDAMTTSPAMYPNNSYYNV